MNRIRELDYFVSGLQLNFGGREKFQTKRGALLTLIIYVLVVIQTAELVENLWTQSDPSIESFVVTDPNNEVYKFKE